MRETPRKQRCTSAGFSLIELCVVMAISVILAAIAVPQVLRTYAAARTRDAANQFSALVQQALILAEQNNVTLPVYTGTVQNGAIGAFVACKNTPPKNCPSGGNSNLYVAGDAAVAYGADVKNGLAANAPAGLAPGFVPAAGTMYFSPRGVTLNAVGGNLVNGFVFYFTDARNDWAAVAVSSIGHSRVYVWTGSKWN